ncbi:MAG: hypothetical protein ABJA67_10885 [Chthonomonadales bacterium]
MPRLFEDLLLNYQWPILDIGDYTHFANPPGDDFSALLAQITLDEVMFTTLIANRLVQFGRAGGGTYDPVCFDLRPPRAKRDCQVVWIDHESILCHRRIRVVKVLAPSFRDLILNSVHSARMIQDQ